jgi:hypothetical protein
MLIVQDGYVPMPGTHREADDSAVDFVDALIAWTAVARPALEHTAKKYRAVVTCSELAEEVQSRRGIRTGSLIMNWIGQVLGRVSHECHRRGDESRHGPAPRCRTGIRAGGHRLAVVGAVRRMGERVQERWDV